MPEGPDLPGEISVPESVLFRELEGESVLLELDAEQYYGLDDVGTRMWLALTRNDTVQGAFEELLGEYDVEPARLRRDLLELLRRLQESGLMEIHESRDVESPDGSDG